MTQGRLAEKTNLSTEFISRIERGVAMPSFKTLETIASVLGVRERDFFDFGAPALAGYTRQEELKKRQSLDYMTRALARMEFRELRIMHKIVTLLADE